MKVTADRDALANLLGRAALAAERKQTSRPVMAGVLLEAVKTDEGGTLSTTTADSSQHLALRLAEPVKVEAEGRVVGPAQLLASYVAKMPEGEVSLTAEDGVIVVRGDGPEFSLRVLDIDEYPTIPMPGGDALEVDGGVLFGAVAKAMPAVGRDSSRPTLTGVLVEVRDGVTNVVSTDSYRLAVSKIDAALATGGQVIIPAGDGTLGRVEKALGSGKLQMRMSENSLSLQNERGVAVLRLIEGQYPAWQSLIATETPLEASFEIKPFVGAMARIELMAGGMVPVTLEFDPAGTLQLSVEHTELGHGGETIGCKFSGEEKFKVAINTRYLMDAIGTLDGDVAEVHMVDSLKPIQLTSAASPGYRHIVMPVRT